MENIIQYDPMTAVNTFELDVQRSKIHVRFQKVGPRSLTLIEGLDEDLDQKRISKAMARAFNCAASIQTTKLGADVIQLQGDQRTQVKEWLLENEILTAKDAEDRLVLHGF